MRELLRWLEHIRSRRRSSATVSKPAWSIYEYIGRDGLFDYEQYRRVQIRANKKKLHSVWVQKENIHLLSEYIRKHIPHPVFGLCHGTRRGLEQQWFAEYIGCQVIGTEISDTAAEFPNTIQWDFHNVKPEWIDATDFIYSNSLDHSYAPDKCLNAWVSCLRPHGILIVEHSTDHIEATETDPFGAQLAVLPFLVLKWSDGMFSVREILQAPRSAKIGEKVHDSSFLIIKRN